MPDAIIIGGSFAGLSAAIYVARAHRQVLIIDAGEPRNRFAQASHGFFGHDGHKPADMITTMRNQLKAYPTVRFVDGKAVSAATTPQGFEVIMADGTRHDSARLVLATGLTDDLPPLPGLKERWGKTVIHCPYCHGYELEKGAIGVLAASAMSVHQALLVAEWGPVTLFTQGTILSPEDHDKLTQRGIAIETTPVTALTGPDSHVTAELADGRTIDLKGLFIAAPLRMTSPLAEQLGCAFEAGPMGSMVQTDEFKQTTIPGVFATGDMARQGHSVSHAVADGVTAGIGMHRSFLSL